MYNSATITANSAEGYSSSQVMEEVAQLFTAQLGEEFGYEWTGVAYQEESAGKNTAVILGLALLVAFLVLAAQYESWTSPIAAITGVPIALLGAIIGCWIADIPVSIYTEIGIVLLIALSAKNGILIVEFARDFRSEGNDIRESAAAAGHVRLRPILMTSLAFVIGVMPLLFLGISFSIRRCFRIKFSEDEATNLYSSLKLVHKSFKIERRNKIY